jgi:hypothetical protein
VLTQTSDPIWTAAAWLTLSAFLLLAALHLAFTGRRFEIRASVSHGRRGNVQALGIEAALAVIACLIFGVVLFSLAGEQPLALRVGFGAAGATVLFTGAWWLFSWLRDTSVIQTGQLRIWRKRAHLVAARLRTHMDEPAIRFELCRHAAEALDAPMAAVFSLDDSSKWVCSASILAAHVGHPPGYDGIDLSLLDPYRTHIASSHPGLALFPMPVSADRVEWFAVTLPRDGGLSAESRSFLELCALQAGAALNSVEAASAFAEKQAELMADERERELWRRALARLVPPDLPDVVGLDYGAEYWRGQSPQGQFLDLISLPKGGLGIVLAEVESAGMEAAVQIAQLQVLLRSRFHAYAEDLAELLQSTERALLASSEKPFPVRLFCARYSPASRTLTYVNAGAVPPVMLHREPDGAQVLRLPKSSKTMALDPPTDFQIADVVLQPGDLVAIASLSLLHNPSADPAEPLSDSRLADSMMCWEDRRASDLVRLVFRTIEEGAPSPSSDRALILLKAV